MSASQVRLKVLLRERHWQTYRVFSGEYDKAARQVDRSLAGYGPSRTQFYRWLSGDVKSLPYPDHCRVLEEMFPGWTAGQLLEPVPDADDSLHGARDGGRRDAERRGPRAAVQEHVSTSSARGPGGSYPSAPTAGAGYPAGMQGAGWLLGLVQQDLGGSPAAAEEAVPAAWRESLIGWLLARREPLPVNDSATLCVGQPDVDAVRATARLFMQLDFQFGGGHARTALAQYFARDVCPLLEGRFTDQVGRELFSAAAEVMQLLGWTAYDIGAHGLSQRYLLQALSLAQAADDRMMGGRLLANMSHQATYLGHFHEAVQLARAAQEGARDASPAVMAMFYAMEARAHAGSNDERACSRALGEAEHLLGRRQVSPDPEWISYFDEAELAGEGAHCFRDLRQPRLTQEFVTRAEALTGSSYVRTRAFLRLVNAASHVHQHEPRQAAAVAAEAIGLAGSLKSDRYLRYVRDLNTDLDRYAELSEVRAFKDLTAGKYPFLVTTPGR